LKLKKRSTTGFQKRGGFWGGKKSNNFWRKYKYILTQKRPFNVKPSFQRVYISTGKILIFFVIILVGIKKKTSPQDKIQKPILFLNYQIFLYRTPFLKRFGLKCYKTMKDNVKFKNLRCWLNIYVCSKNGGRGIKKKWKGTERSRGSCWKIAQYHSAPYNKHKTSRRC